MDESERQPEKGEKGSKLPATGQRVMVRCRGYSCLAYRDKEGKWRDAARDVELAEVLEVLWEP